MMLEDPIFKTVTKSAELIQQPTYVVGGYVRDYFLHRPCKDIDFVTVGSGIKLAETVHQQLEDSKLSVFKNFGTAQLVWNGL